jgi:hypothetical protein
VQQGATVAAADVQQPDAPLQIGQTVFDQGQDVFVQAGVADQFNDSRRREFCHGIEQAGAVADGDHQGECTLIQHAEQLIGELVDGLVLRGHGDAGVTH